MLHTVTVPFKKDQVPVMDKPVDHGCRHLVIREDAPPLGKLQISSKKETFALITVGDDPEQQLGTFTVDGDISPFIEDQQINTVQVAAEPFQCTVLSGFCKFEDQFSYSIKPHFIALHTGVDTCSDSHVCLADSDRTVKHEIILVFYEADILQFLTGKAGGSFTQRYSYPSKVLYVGKRALLTNRSALEYRPA